MRVKFADGEYNFFWAEDTNGNMWIMRVKRGRSFMHRIREFEDHCGLKIYYYTSKVYKASEENAKKSIEKWIFEHQDHLRQFHGLKA